MRKEQELIEARDEAKRNWDAAKRNWIEAKRNLDAVSRKCCKAYCDWDKAKAKISIANID